MRRLDCTSLPKRLQNWFGLSPHCHCLGMHLQIEVFEIVLEQNMQLKRQDALIRSADAKEASCSLVWMRSRT